MICAHLQMEMVFKKSYPFAVCLSRFTDGFSETLLTCSVMFGCICRWCSRNCPSTSLQAVKFPQAHQINGGSNIDKIYIEHKCIFSTQTLAECLVSLFLIACFKDFLQHFVPQTHQMIWSILWGKFMFVMRQFQSTSSTSLSIFVSQNLLQGYF